MRIRLAAGIDEVAAQWIRVGKERVQKLLKQHGISARGKRKLKATTRSNHSLPVGAKPARAELLADGAQYDSEAPLQSENRNGELK